MKRPLLYPLWLLACSVGVFAADAKMKPNVIFILADDMGYGEAGCYGQELVCTPHLDRMAREGVRFTQAYTATSVCAPARCALLTGKHLGHAAIRANRRLDPEGQQPLPAGTFTLAHLFKQAGYATGAFGKWALGYIDSSGAPDKMGFDTFFGYNCQNLAHSYYPDHLWRNSERVELDGKTYSHDLIAAEALKWLRQQSSQPFFLYLPFTIPHYNFEVPDLGPYADKPWPEERKIHAAMLTRLDATIGSVLATLKEMKLDEQTLVIFSSDNGADNPGALEFFRSNGPLRGGKRTMYEGGLRVPMVVRWPGRIQPGVNDTQWAFYDVLATMSDLIANPLPAGLQTDGISVLPALLDGRTMERDFLYWELHEWKYVQAARAGDWKVVRDGPRAPLELYDLAKDPAESVNLAKQHPEVVQRLAEVLKREHVPDPLWSDDLPPKEKETSK
jgi:arylsulfatase A-like enzyme